jgi:hypothetical protein
MGGESQVMVLRAPGRPTVLANPNRLVPAPKSGATPKSPEAPILDHLSRRARAVVDALLVPGSQSSPIGEILRLDQTGVRWVGRGGKFCISGELKNYQGSEREWIGSFARQDIGNLPHPLTQHQFRVSTSSR